MEIALQVHPLPSSALKRNGLQDQNPVESGGISYIRKCWHEALCTDYPVCLPVKPPKKISALPANKS